MTEQAFEPIPIFKDGKPGWITGFDSTISDGDFADIEMQDGRMTFVRYPHGGRIIPRERGACAYIGTVGDILDAELARHLARKAAS